jgi:hypothetical protein
MQASPGTPLSTPIPMALYPVLATLLTTSGLAVTALFFVCVPAQSQLMSRTPLRPGCVGAVPRAPARSLIALVAVSAAAQVCSASVYVCASPEASPVSRESRTAEARTVQGCC